MMKKTERMTGKVKRLPCHINIRGNAMFGKRVERPAKGKGSYTRKGKQSKYFESMLRQVFEML